MSPSSDDELSTVATLSGLTCHRSVTLPSQPSRTGDDGGGGGEIVTLGGRSAMYGTPAML